MLTIYRFIKEHEPLEQRQTLSDRNKAAGQTRVC